MSSMLHRWLLVAPLAASVLPCTARAQCEYEVAVIDGVSCSFGGVQAFQPRGLGESGDVLGSGRICAVSVTSDGYVWSGTAGLQALDRPPAFDDARPLDQSPTGVVVGSLSSDAGFRGVLWQHPTAAATLLSIPLQANGSQAFAINDSEQIVGEWSHTVSGNKGATLWEADRLMLLILPMGLKSGARDINDLGQVVGWMGSAPHVDAHGFLWHKGKVTDLGTVPGGFTAEPLALNSRGDIVGQGWIHKEGFPIGVLRAFISLDGITHVVDPIDGHLRSSARDINDVKQAVIHTWKIDPEAPIEDPFKGFLWQHGAMISLDDLLEQPGFEVDSADAINDNGQIVARGKSVTNPNHTPGLLLTPIGRPPGDVDIDCRTGLTDLLFIIDDWGLVGSPADVNNDGVVDVDDLVIVLVNWSS